MPKQVKLYLVRHAEPVTLEYKNYFPGPLLGEKGKQQAQKVALYLKDKAIEQIYASDFARVKDTLQYFLTQISNTITPIFNQSLWEREKEIESHQSLVLRINNWLDLQSKTIAEKNTAIFSHCGPINMILQYFDPCKTLLQYTYTCPYGCHTPLAGVWELELRGSCLVNGRLISLELMKEL